MGVSKTSNHIKITIKMPNPSQEPPASSKAPNEDLKDMDVLCTFKIKIESQNSDDGYMKNQWQYPNQDQEAKPQSGTSSILQSPKSAHKGHGCSLNLQNQDREPNLALWFERPVTIYRSKIKMKYPSQEAPVYFKAPNTDLKDMDVLCTFKIKIDIQNFKNGCIKNQ